ncbi:MAG: SPFH/Band 7/PHB domain protein [Armatimonadetes bacterium]|nr:SPFH/Band 7/PHB domain protein [Armatimonadota bacterium]
MQGLLILLSVPIILLLILLGMAVRIVPEYNRLVVFRLGRIIGAKGPGLILLVPFVDRGVRVDFRETFFDVPPQTTITKDNAPVSIDFLVYMKIVDAVPSVVNVEDYDGAARGIAITTLRAVVGDMALDDVLSRRDEINEALRTKLDEVTNRWGIKVTAVEIREIIPPPVIQEAMTRQMSAERTRRAQVTEATGTREASITIAEGSKQAAILEAEGKRQATLLEAEGYALALQSIHNVARNVDGNTMSLQYLEALRALGNSPATKMVIPAEFTNLLRPFLEHTRQPVE